MKVFRYPNWLLPLAVAFGLMSVAVAAHAQIPSTNVSILIQSGASKVTTIVDPGQSFSTNHAIEFVWSGTAASTASFAIAGAMPGGTTCTLTGAVSSTSTSNVVLYPTGICAKLNITTSWTGGDSTTRLTINSLGATYAKLSGSGTSTVSGITGMTAGQTAVGDNNGNMFSDGLLALDVKSGFGFAGDLCDAILACYATASPFLGCNASSYTGNQACHVNPFPATGNATPLYLSPDVTIQAQKPWIVPTATPIFGADIPSASAPGTTLQATTTLQNLRVATITSYTITSNVATFQVANAWSAGQSIVLSGFSGGDAFLNAQTVIPCAGTNCTNLNPAGISSTMFQAPVVHADVPSGGAGVGTGNVALLAWGTFGSGGTGGVSGGGQFNAGIYSMRIDGNSKGVTCVYDYAGQEHTFMRNSQITDCGSATIPGIALDVESSHSQHFTVDHVQIFNRASTSCNPADLLIKLNGAIDFSIDYSTLTTQACDSAIDGSLVPVTEVTIDGSQGIVFGPHYNHFEGPDSLPTGTAPTQTVFRIGDTTGNTGVVISGSSGGNFQNDTASTMFEIANNSNKNISIENFTPKGSQLTNAVVDNQNGNTITRTNNTSFSKYTFISGLPHTDAIPEAGIVSAIFDSDGLLIRTAANSSTAPFQISMGGQSSVFPAAGASIAGGTNTGATNVPMLSITNTWNNGSISGPTFFVNTTNTASAANSLLVEVQATSADKFTVDSGGAVRAAGSYGTTSAATAANFFAGAGTAALAGSGVGAGTTIKGLDNSSANASSAAGYLVVRGGELTNASPVATQKPGGTQLVQGFVKTGTITAAGDVVCVDGTTNLAVSDCPLAATDIAVAGIACGNANPIGVVIDGIAPVITDNSAALGNHVCAPVTGQTAGKGHAQAGACGAGIADIGLVLDIGANNTAFTGCGGSSVSVYTLSATQPLVLLHIVNK
jgi:hypothetical protein